MRNKNLSEVSPGIFRITERGVLGMLKPPVNIYVIAGRNGLIFDSGYGDSISIRKFSKAYSEINKICSGRGVENNIDRILLSHAHADHFSGLKRLRKKLGFRIILTEEMKIIISSGSAYKNSYAPPDVDSEKNSYKFLSFILKKLNQRIQFRIYSTYWGITFVDNPDITIESETEIVINSEKWEIFRSPGHSAEHITLYNREKGILFSGDNVLKSINVWLGPPKSDIDDYENSLIKMLNLPDLKIILPAHGSPIFNPYRRLNEIIEWRRKRTEDVLMLLKNSDPGGLTIKEILEILYPSDSRMKKEFAGGWVELTLAKLRDEDRIICEKNRYYYRSVR